MPADYSSNFPLYWDGVDKLWLEKVREIFFTPTKGVIGISKRYNTIIDGRLHLGLWPDAPSANITYLLHEMGHFIEIDNARCHLPDWGLKAGKWNKFFNCSEGMVTNKAIERELRVFAIERYIASICDMVPKSFEYDASICRHIDGFISYGDSDLTDYSEKQKSAEQNIAKRIELLTAEWNEEKVISAWFNKVKVLNKKGKLKGFDYHQDKMAA